jgi:pimeloyl-ACP methyl ester carboxylesterase
VVLLHGLLGSGRNLAALARRWSQLDPALRLVALDLTGHGTSPPLPPGADLVTLARDVVATLESLELPLPVRVVGHSLGGRVALKARALRPDAIDLVDLLDIAPGPVVLEGAESKVAMSHLLEAPAELPSREAARQWLIARSQRADGSVQDGRLTLPLIEWLLMNLVNEGGVYRWRVARGALAELHDRVLGEDLWPTLAPRVAPHTRCVRGGLSRYVSSQDVQRFAAVGAPPVATLPEAGHFVHVDALEPLLQWLGAPPPR